MEPLRDLLDYLYTRNSYSFLVKGTVGLGQTTLDNFTRLGENHMISFSLRLQSPHDVILFMTQWAVQNNAGIDMIHWEHPHTKSRVSIHYSLRCIETTSSSRRILGASIEFSNLTGFYNRQEIVV